MNPFKPPFIPPVNSIETARLRIRIDTEASYVERFRTATDAELMAWCGFSRPEELALQKLKVEGGFSNYRISTLFFHLIENTSGLVIGSLAFHNWYPMHRRSEIGYAMNGEAFKRQGYMKEALPAVLRFGFDVMDLNRVEAFISPENLASRSLVERAGFRLEGELREHYTHEGQRLASIVYGLLRSDRSATGI